MNQLRMHRAAGHMMAHHFYNHYNLNKVIAEKSIESTIKAHVALDALPNFKPFLVFLI